MIDAKELILVLEHNICDSAICLDKEEKDCRLCPISVIFQTIDLLDKRNDETFRKNVSAILNSNFSETKEEIIEIALNNICALLKGGAEND